MCCKERYHITFNPIQTGLFWLLLPVTGWNNIRVTSILLKQWRNLMPSLLSYPMNPYALRTCAVGASCHVLTDLKLNIVEFSVFRYTISWYITNYKFLVHYNYIILWQNPNSPQSSRKAKKRNIKKLRCPMI